MYCQLFNNEHNLSFFRTKGDECAVYTACTNSSHPSDRNVEKAMNPIYPQEHVQNFTINEMNGTNQGDEMLCCTWPKRGE